MRVRTVSDPNIVCAAGPLRRAQGSGFRVQGSGSRVQGSGFRVQGSGFRVQGSGFRVQGPQSSVSFIRSSDHTVHHAVSKNARCAATAPESSVRMGSRVFFSSSWLLSSLELCSGSKNGSYCRLIDF